MLLIILFIDKDEKARKERRKEGERERMKKRKNLSKRSTNSGKKKNARAWVKAVNLYMPVPVKGNEWRGSISNRSIADMKLTQITVAVMVAI